MGFYAPAQIVGDARKNGVEVREIDVSFSYAQNTLEEGAANIARCGSASARSTVSDGRCG
jgi:DNA polymerase III alpha subunit